MSNHLFCFKFCSWLNASFFRQETHYLKNYPFGSVSSSVTWPTGISKSLKLKRIFSPLEPYLILAYTIEFFHLKQYFKLCPSVLKKISVCKGKKLVSDRWTKLPESYWDISIFDSGEKICKNKIVKVQFQGVSKCITMWPHCLWTGSSVLPLSLVTKSHLDWNSFPETISMLLLLLL